MIDIIGWTLVTIMFMAYFLDLSVTSKARDKLRVFSECREVDRMADFCERIDLPYVDADSLTEAKVIHLNEAWRRLGYTLAPHWVARLLVKVHQ